MRSSGDLRSSIEREALDTYNLFKARAGLSDADLTDALEKWCTDVDGIADKKHQWLVAAKWFLILNSIASVVLLVAVMWL